MSTIQTEAAQSVGKAVLLYGIVSFFLFFEMAIQVSPSVISTELMRDLNLGAFGLGLMSGVYFYTYTLMQMPSGLLFDFYNPRLIITVSLLMCVVGTLLFSFADSIYMGAIARLLMGCGSAFAFVSVLVVTADLFKAKYFATITGITQMLAAFGAMSGQMPIRFLVENIGWRHAFQVLSLLGVLLAFAVWKLLKYKRKNTYPHNILYTTKQNLSIIVSQPQTWFIAFYACLLWVPMSTFGSLWGVPFLTHVYHYSETQSALMCSFMWLGLALMSPVLGQLSSSFKNRVWPLIISALLGIISFGLVLSSSFTFSIISLLLFGAGAACAGQALSFTLIKENNHDEVKATAIAFNNMAVVISGAVFQPLIGKIIEMGRDEGPTIFNPIHFKQGLEVILASYIIAFLIALIFIKNPKNYNR